MQCVSSPLPTLRLARLSAPTPQPAARHTLSEVFPSAVIDGAAVGFVLAHVPPPQNQAQAPIFWVQDRLSRLESGVPYLPGLGGRQVIRVEVNRPVDVLWAIEEGLRCRALCMVIGELWGQPKALDFTASKRLALRAERYKVPCWLIRRGATPDLSAARNRWRVGALPSHPDPADAQAPGVPRWKVELFRSRDAKPGTWVASYDRAANCFDLVAAPGDGAVAEDHGATGRAAAR